MFGTLGYRAEEDDPLPGFARGTTEQGAKRWLSWVACRLGGEWGSQG